MNKLDKYLNEKFVKLNRIKRLELIHPKPTKPDLPFGMTYSDNKLAVVYDAGINYWTNIYSFCTSKNIRLTNDQVNHIIASVDYVGGPAGKYIITSSGMIKELFKRKQPLKPEEKKRLKIIG